MNFKLHFKNSLKYCSFLIIFFFLLIFSSKIIQPKSIPTMALPEESKLIKQDLNGDSIVDLLYITSRDDKYYIETSINGKTYFLNEKRPLNTLGKHYDFAPIQINTNDVSRDNIPELFIQSFENNVPIQHIYTFTGDEFKDIFCSTNNTLGIINSKNNKSPKYISFDLNNFNSTLQKYMLTNSTPKNISFDDITIPGINVVQNLISFTTTDIPIGDIFLENTPQKTYDTLDIIDKSQNTYSLLDCFFIDKAWDRSGEIIKIDWNIRLKSTNIESDNQSFLEMNVSLTKTENKFLIDDLKIKKGH
ncbi:MAG: hypothetical protein ACRC6T_05075 [Sarcina sp.]